MPGLLNDCEWRVTATSGPPGRIGHTFCANGAGTLVFLYGGLSANDEVSPNYLDDFWVYDVQMKTWTSIELRGAVQSPRAFHTAVWHDGGMYIFGGCNGRGRFNKLFCVSPNGDCKVMPFSGPPPQTRYCHSAVVYSDAMYVYGGKCGGRNSNRRLSDFLMYRFNQVPMDTKWIYCEQIGDPPEARSAQSAVVHRDSMLILGGRNAEGNCCDDVHSYNFKTFTWRRYDLPFSPFGRARNSCVVHNGYVVLFGGWNGRKKLNDLVFFHVDSMIVSRTDQLFPSVRECQVAVVCHNTMIVFGGRWKTNYMQETLELNLGSRSVADDIIDFSVTNSFLSPDLISLMPQRLQQAYHAREEDLLDPHLINGVASRGR